MPAPARWGPVHSGLRGYAVACAACALRAVAFSIGQRRFPHFSFEDILKVALGRKAQRLGDRGEGLVADCQQPPGLVHTQLCDVGAGTHSGVFLKNRDQISE